MLAWVYMSPVVYIQLIVADGYLVSGGLKWVCVCEALLPPSEGHKSSSMPPIVCAEFPSKECAIMAVN